jgi:hypothetical protein
MSACPSEIDPNALPSIAPKALLGSRALIAWPGVGEVVNKSPTRIGARSHRLYSIPCPSIPAVVGQSHE